MPPQDGDEYGCAQAAEKPPPSSNGLPASLRGNAKAEERDSDEADAKRLAEEQESTEEARRMLEKRLAAEDPREGPLDRIPEKRPSAARMSLGAEELVKIAEREARKLESSPGLDTSPACVRSSSSTSPTDENIHISNLAVVRTSKMSEKVPESSVTPA